jgi:predicted Zn-dependent protease
MRAAWLALAVALSGCAAPAGERPRYLHNRDDYLAFREVWPELLEPNYLPFMVYDVPAEPLSALRRLGIRLGLAAAPGRRLVFCHWTQEDMPLAVWIEPPVGLDAIEEEGPVRAPERYVEAAEEALATWQRDLDGAVRFERASSPGAADFEVRLLAERAPEPTADVRVYGAAAVGDSCRVLGGDPEFRLDVRFRVRDVRLYVADEHGLLLPDQVEGIARHEIGHALGMRGHSPIPADLMFEEADDRRDREGLGLSDTNSFLSLYAIPSGTVYADPGAARAPARRLLAEGTPRLDPAPHVDTRLGFEIQLPEGWQRQPTPYGVVAVNGLPWDYEASFQLNVHRFDTIEDFVERFGPAYLIGADLLSIEHRELAGHRAREVQLRTDLGTRESLTLIESGDGRVLVAIAECPAEQHAAYRPWFLAVLDSLEIADREQRPHGRTYGPEGAR